MGLSLDTTEKRALWLLLRYAVYILLLFLLYLALVYVILPQKWPFSRNRLMEYMQLTLLTLLSAALGINALIFARTRKLLLLLMSFSMIAIVREVGKILDKYIPVLGWKAVFLLVAPLILILMQLRNGQKLRKQISKFIPSQAMAIFLMGIIIIIPLAQCIGDASYLRTAIGGEYIHAYETLFEESMELYGYVILLCGAFETMLFSWQFHKEEMMIRYGYFRQPKQESPGQ
ncbi:MAG: hypothetical protein GX574_05010 [Lentisphaerae bacterium]|nr:hypothetical protein [Lentisphaerota bacterium]OQC17833.1 MAG: hypothetical protein BWX73_00041 [Lentisphaerae bacterium ADurb.Bin082]